MPRSIGYRSSDYPSRVSRALFTVLMMFAWSGGAEVAAGQAAGQAAGPGATPDRKTAADTVDRLLKMLELADRESPRDTFDPQAVAQKAGRDPTRLFEWVRDNTHWVPYRGALRGPRGVLMDRVGNTLDRALLLAELLRSAGRQVRLVRATLTAEQAGRLVAAVRPLPDDRLAPLAPQEDGQMKARLAAYAAKFGVDAGRVQASADGASVQTAKAAELVVARVADQAPALIDAVGKPLFDDAAAPADSGGADVDPAAAAADHWWVAYEQNGAWVDVDPMLPDARHGTKSVDAPGAAMPYVGTLPADATLCHEVTIEVKVGRLTVRGLEEATALKHTLRPADVLGTRVALTHLPLNWPAEADLLKEKDPAAKVKELASAQHEWVPILHVGPHPVIQSGFDDTGRINKNPALAPMKKTGAGAASAAKSAFDVLSADPSPEAAKPDGQWVAEWIDYEIRSPGRPPQRVRRQLFDLLAGASAGDAAGVFPLNLTATQTLDRALSPLGETEIFLQPCAVSAAFVDHVAAQGALANRRAILAMVSRENPDPSFAGEQIGGLVTPPGAVYGLAVARSLWSPVKAEVYLDRPNVLTRHQVLRVDPNDPSSKLTVCEGFDLVCNDVAVRHKAPDGARRPSPRSVRLQQGVADTAAEAALVSGCGKVENAGELFAAATGRGERWLTLSKPDDPKLATLELPKESRALLERDLAAGYVVVAPVKAAQADARPLVGWWRVDPRTGQTLGITAQGWGGAVTAENVATLRLVLKVGLTIKCIGKALGGTGNIVGDITICSLVGIIGAAGLAGGVGGGILSAVADIISFAK